MNPVSAGVFGVPIGFATIVSVSLLTPQPSCEVQELVDHANRLFKTPFSLGGTVSSVLRAVNRALLANNLPPQ